MSANLIIPEFQSIADYLNTAGAFIKLTDAKARGLEPAAEFVAVQRAAISLIAPAAADDRVETEGGGGITSPWRIACLFDHGVLHGQLDFLVNMRLSDYLRQQTGFLVVREATWTPSEMAPAGASPAPAGQWPVALVNPARVLAIVEGQNPAGAGHPGRLAPTEWDL